MATRSMGKQDRRPTLPEMLDEAIDRERISKSEAARRLGITNMTYRGWERGVSPRIQQNPEFLDSIATFTGHPRAAVLAAIGILKWDEAERLGPNRDTGVYLSSSILAGAA